MSVNDYHADQLSALDSIQRFGQTLYLMRDGVVRPVSGAVVRRRPAPREGQLAQFTPRHALLSPVGLDIPPDHELDRLIEGNELLRMVARPRKIAPAGIVIFWDADVLEIGGSPVLFPVSLVNPNSLGSLILSELA